MDIFDIDPNALIILVIMVIGGLKWALERMKSRKEQDDEASPETFEDLYEEARRDIQERQNRQIPTAEETRERLEDYQRPTIFETTASPPPLAPKPPPLPAKKRSFKKPAYDQSAPPPSVRTILSEAEKKALARVQAGGMDRPHKRRRPSGRSQVRRLLASPTAARDAIVFREILGPPKGASQEL